MEMRFPLLCTEHACTHLNRCAEENLFEKSMTYTHARTWEPIPAKNMLKMMETRAVSLFRHLILLFCAIDAHLRCEMQIKFANVVWKTDSFFLCSESTNWIVWNMHIFFGHWRCECHVACRESLAYWISLRICMHVFISHRMHVKSIELSKRMAYDPTIYSKAYFESMKIQRCALVSIWNHRIQNTSHQNHVQCVTSNNLNLVQTLAMKK